MEHMEYRNLEAGVLECLGVVVNPGSTVNTSAPQKKWYAYALYRHQEWYGRKGKDGKDQLEKPLVTGNLQYFPDTQI